MVSNFQQQKEHFVNQCRINVQVVLVLSSEHIDELLLSALVSKLTLCTKFGVWLFLNMKFNRRWMLLMKPIAESKVSSNPSVTSLLCDQARKDSRQC